MVIQPPVLGELVPPVEKLLGAGPVLGLPGLPLGGDVGVGASTPVGVVEGGVLVGAVVGLLAGDGAVVGGCVGVVVGGSVVGVRGAGAVDGEDGGDVAGVLTKAGSGRWVAEGEGLLTCRAMGSMRCGSKPPGDAARLVNAPATVGTTVEDVAAALLGAAAGMGGRIASGVGACVTCPCVTCVIFGSSSDSSWASEVGQFMAAVRPATAMAVTAATATADRLRHPALPRPA
ncbi:hypothetical protein CcI156_11985 [Frankia sp. CcI156]|nr:hypothetical protein CcI156_11985 [Frankia sp. CcI156]